MNPAGSRTKPTTWHKNVQSLQCILTWKNKLELEKRRGRLDVFKMAAYLTCAEAGWGGGVLFLPRAFTALRGADWPLQVQSQRSCPTLAPLERTQWAAPRKLPITKSINITELSVSAATSTQHHHLLGHLLQFLSSIPFKTAILGHFPNFFLAY